MLIVVLISLPTTLSLILWSLGYYVRRQKNIRSKIQSVNLGIIIPAHNEEKGIAKAIRSLNHFNRDVIVIADNCSDTTAEVALKEGASVIQRESPIKGKPAALNEAFSQLKGMNYSHYLIIDADTEVSSNLVDEIEKQLERGFDLVQAHYTVKRHDPESRLYYLKLESMNHLRPKARQNLSLPPGCYGNGFAISKSIVDSFPFHEELAEDLSLFYELALNNKELVFTDRAYVLSEKPPHREAEKIQSSRWDQGRFHLIKRYFWPLLKEFRLDLLVNLLTLPLSIYILLLILIAFFYPYYSLMGFILILIHSIQTFRIAKGSKQDFFALKLIPKAFLLKLANIPNLFKKVPWLRTPR